MPRWGLGVGAVLGTSICIGGWRLGFCVSSSAQGLVLRNHTAEQVMSHGGGFGGWATEHRLGYPWVQPHVPLLFFFITLKPRVE